MNMKQRVTEAVAMFEKEYPNAECALTSETPFQLLVATRLSARCTDARVNTVTPVLFARYPDAESLAAADVANVESIIKSCGLYREKARDLINTARLISEKYGGVLPESMEELLKLPGVGRKTANLIRGDVFGKPAIVADTHFIRLCNRLGFVNTSDPRRVETTMRDLLPPDKSNAFCHRAVIHGRAVCKAVSPKCGKCCLAVICPARRVEPHPPVSL